MKGVAKTSREKQWQLPASQERERVVLSCALARSALPAVDGAAWGVPVWKSPEESPKELERHGVQGTDRPSSCGGGGDWRQPEKGKVKRKEKGKDAKVLMTAFLARSTQSLDSAGVSSSQEASVIPAHVLSQQFRYFPYHARVACYAGLPNHPRGTHSLRRKPLLRS